MNMSFLVKLLSLLLGKQQILDNLSSPELLLQIHSGRNGYILSKLHSAPNCKQIKRDEGSDYKVRDGKGKAARSPWSPLKYSSVRDHWRQTERRENLPALAPEPQKE